MKNIIAITSLLTLTACPVAMEHQPDPYPLSGDLYEWTCKDYSSYTEINVSTETCDDSVEFIVAELHLDDASTLKTNLKTGYPGDCRWSETFLLIEEYCQSGFV